jgi:hypothetical protein
MNTLHKRITEAFEVYQNDLNALEQMITAFHNILILDIGNAANRINAKLKKVSEFYFEETWDSSEVITSALDLVFSELEAEQDDFQDEVDKLNSSLKLMQRNYKEFILPQGIVLLVSSLELFLATIFKNLLRAKLRGVNEYAVNNICRGVNFQNWGSTIDAYRTFLDIDFNKSSINRRMIVEIQQERHIIVHRRGLLDEKSLKLLGVSKKQVGRRLKFSEDSIYKAISLFSESGKVIHEIAEQKIWDGI